MARGIAAVMDAVFLLLIAVVASGIVYMAAANYGKNFNVQAQKLLLNYYAKQVVRTIVTASIEREKGVPDYLLSYIKENVEFSKDLGPAEGKLKDVVRKAMRPIGNQYDYVVLLDAVDSSWGKAYVIYKITRSGSTDEGTCTLDKSSYDSFKQWVDGLGEVYSSSTTIFMRYNNSYIPVDIRVIVFPQGNARSRPC